VKTATKTALGQVRSFGLVPKLIAKQTKLGLAKDVVTYPAVGDTTLSTGARTPTFQSAPSR
jgi:hypothetical protein